VRKQLGQTQKECALALRRLGAVDCAQQAISDWERGRTHRPGATNISVIRRYLAESGLATKSDNESDLSHDDPGVLLQFPGRTEDPQSGHGPAAGEEAPPVGDELDRAIVRRLGTGPPLSRWDMEAIRGLREGRP
jgi:transcriptional regulator with XRE-family HTH domain